MVFINRRSSLRAGVVPDPLVRKTKSDVGRSHKRRQLDEWYREPLHRGGMKLAIAK